METLLPSEIARLVYGYLIEEKCDAAARLFLETSEYLKECNYALKKGRKFNTRVMGLCLVDLLNLYTDAVCLLKNFKERESVTSADSNNVIEELGRVLLLDELSEKNVSKTVFLRISIPPKRKSSSARESPDKRETEEKTVERREAEKKKDETGSEPSDSPNQTKTSTQNGDDFDATMLQTLLVNTTLHERIAENINKAMDSSGEITNPKTDEKKIIETVLHSTETDPIFDELLDMLVAPRAEDTTTPEDTDKENGDPTEDRLVHGHTAVQEQETIKRLEAESNLAIEGILAGNKKIQHETIVTAPHPSNLIPVDRSQVPAAITGAVKEMCSVSSSPAVSNAMVIPFNSSTPLQPIRNSNIPLIGFLSPVQSVKSPSMSRGVLTKVSSVGARGALQGRRRRIIPKPDGVPITSVIHVQVQNQDFSSQLIEAVPVQSVPEVLKKPVVRTRGGLRKTGSRGVKSITPQISNLNDDNVNVVFLESKARPKTRSMFKKKKCEVNTTNETANNSEQPILVVTQTTDSEEQSRKTPDKPNDPNEPDALNRTEDTLNDLNITPDTPPDTTKDLNISPDSPKDVNKPQETPNELNKSPILTKTPQELPEVYQEPLLHEQEEVLPKSTPQEDSEIQMEEKQSELTGSQPNEPQSSDLTENTESEFLNPPPPEIETVDTDLNSEPSTASQTLNETCNETDDCITTVIQKEICDDGTPEQQTAVTKFKPRISLSTPRRGSHIRVLDFKTPDKNFLEVRKSLTSPKVYPKSKQLEKFENVKRGLLNSPEPNKEVGKKNNWDADLRQFLSADNMDIPTSVGLKRKIGSKRGNRGNSQKTNSRGRGNSQKTNSRGRGNSQKTNSRGNSQKISSRGTSHKINSRGNRGKFPIRRGRKPLRISDTEESDVSPTKPSGLCSSNEDLVKQIEKEVRDVVGDDFSLSSSGNSESLKMLDKKLMSGEAKNSKDSSSGSDMEIEDLESEKLNATLVLEPNLKNDEAIRIPSLGNSLPQSSPGKEVHVSEINSPDKVNPMDHGETVSSETNADLSKSPASNEKIIEQERNFNVENLREPNVEMQVSETTQENPSVTSYEQECINATPLKLPVSPSNDNSLGQITPTTKVLISHLGSSLNSPVLSPHSYSNLESILITEGTRLENEKAMQVVQDTTILSQPPSDNKSTSNEVLKKAESEPGNKANDPSEKSENSILPMAKPHEIKSLNFLKTPAKPLTGPAPFGIPVEMTPLTKVLHSETKILSTALVTPTLPATPQPPRDEKSPDKSDGLVSLTDEPSCYESTHSKDQVLKENISTKKDATKSSKIEQAFNRKKQTQFNAVNVAVEESKESFPSEAKSTDTSPNSKKESLKVSKTPRIKLLPKKAEIQDYINRKPKPKTGKLFIQNSGKATCSEENEELSPKRRIRKGAADKNIEAITSRGMKTSTPKIKKVKTIWTEDLSFTKKKKAYVQNNTPGKKISPNKSTSKFHLDLMKKEEQVLKECLQNAKAKLFGIDSSDSDSSDECTKKKNTSGASNKSIANVSGSSGKEIDTSRSQWNTARDRLRKLESVSMLMSSDSSDESIITPAFNTRSAKKESSDIESKKLSTVPVCLKETQKNNERNEPVDLNINEIKKLGSLQKVEKNDNSKLLAKDKEESCESFPPLYLSEESNLSAASESHIVKSMKFRKSPSSSSDLLKKVSNASERVTTPIIETPSVFRLGKQSFPAASNDKAVASTSKPLNLPIASTDQTVGVGIQEKIVKGLDAYETVIRQQPTKGSALSSQERQTLTEYVKNYTFSFTLDAEGQDDLVCKTLRTSPFFTIFELNRKDTPHSEPRSKPPERMNSSKSPPSRERPRKRHRSKSSSGDEKRKFPRVHNKSPRDYHSVRSRSSPQRRRDYSLKKSYSTPHFRNSPHYHAHKASFNSRRPRCNYRDRILKNIPLKGQEKRPHKRSPKEQSDVSPHSSKSVHSTHRSFDKRYNFNDSLRSSKSSESDKLLVDHSFRSSESPQDRKTDISNVSINERTHLTLSKSNKAFLRLARKEDREDGELSDSSELQPLQAPSQLGTAEAQRKLIELVTDRSKASLLKKVDLDHFLTLLHGEEK